MTKEEIDKVLNSANRKIFAESAEAPIGVTKFQAFLSIRPLLKNELYWSALKKAWRSTDGLYDYKKDIEESFTANISGKEALMTKDELNYLNSLDDRLTIYRGMTMEEFESNDFGISWTLEKEIADFFASDGYSSNKNAVNKKRCVHQIEINKIDVIAYFNDLDLNGRHEKEIIYMDENKIEFWKRWHANNDIFNPHPWLKS